MPRTRSLAWSELKIGIVAVAALVLAIVLILAVGGQGGFCLAALRAEDEVHRRQGAEDRRGRARRRRGCRQGDRRWISPAPKCRSRSRSTRRMQSRITDQSRASIGSLSLLGEPIIEISPAARARRSRTATSSRARARRGRSPTWPRAPRRRSSRRRRSQGHPRRQGHRRQAVHRRRAVPRDECSSSTSAEASSRPRSTAARARSGSWSRTPPPTSRRTWRSRTCRR